jgi:hypothetical protein
MAGKNYDINFRIKTDAKPTRKELEMTVAEFKDFNKTVRASQTPLDRFEKDLSDLNKTLKAGGVTADQYEHRLKDIESRYSKATVQQKKFKTGVNGLSNALKNMVVSYAAFSTVQKGFRAVREEMERIDRFGKQAASLGATTEFLSGLEFAAQRTSGLAIGAATKGIEKMTRRIEEAALGTGEAIKALEMLGLEAKALARLNPEEQFQVLSRAMDKVTDAGERTLIATKLFDDEQSKLHTTMALTNESYQEQIKLAERLGVVVTKAEADKAAAYVDSMQRQEASLNRFKKALAQESLGGLNFLSAEGTTARADFFSGFLEGDGNVKADLLMGLFGAQIDKGVSATGSNTTTEALMGRKMATAKTQAQIDEQRAGYLREEVEAEKRITAELNKQLGWEELLTKDQAKRDKLGVVGSFFGSQLEDAKKTAAAIGGGLSHFGLSVTGRFDRMMNTRSREDGEKFEKIISDPAESVTANSSEAFRLQNQQTSMLKVEKEDSKKTAKNTKGTWDTTQKVYDLLANANGIGL